MTYSTSKVIESEFDTACVQSKNTQDEEIDTNDKKTITAFSVYLLERRIDCMDVFAIVEAVEKACNEDKKIILANYNINAFNLSMQLPWYQEFLQNADIVNCDGMGILKAISIMGLDLPLDYRVSYTLLMPKILENCNQNEFSVFLLGGKYKHLNSSLDNLNLNYPKIILAGHHGYFDKEDSEANQVLIKQINQLKPNILLVGMGMPIQEYWVNKYRDSLNVNTIMLGGAIIDRIAGIVPDCPHLIAMSGFEWLYRLLREPKRLAARYLLGNSAFGLHIVLAIFNKSRLRVEFTSKVEKNNIEMK